MEWRNWGHRCSTGFFLFCLSSSMMDYYKLNIPETEAVVGKDSDYCTVFFLVITHSLAFTRLVAGSHFPASVSCITHFWLLHNSLSLPLPIFARSFLFVIMICGRGVGGWAGKADKLLVCSGLRCCSFLPLFLVLARAWCGWTVPGMARTVVVDAVHMSSLHDYDME